MAPLTPVVMVTRGLDFHPCFCIALFWGWYLVCPSVVGGASGYPNALTRTCSGDFQVGFS